MASKTPEPLPTIVVTGEIFSPGSELLAEAGHVRQLHQPTPAEIHEAVVDADAVIVRIHHLTGETIRAAPGLRVIGRFGVGIDNIDVDAATSCGIPVVYTPGANAQAVAEHALTMALCLMKRLSVWRRELLAGNWDARWTGHSDDVVGSTLGVVGLGNVGRRLAELAAGVKMHVVGCDTMLTPKAAKQFGVELKSLDDVLRESDVVSLHVPLTEETRCLIDQARLARMKPGAHLINTARGGLLDIDAVHAALETGKLGGIALDVYPDEPPDLSHPLFHHPNFIGSPHCASHTQATLRNMGQIVAREVSAALRGQRPLFVANPLVFEEAAKTK